MGKLRKYILSAVSGPSSINVVFGLVCLVEIISLSNAQNKIKCFNENKNRMKALGGVMLDCSNMIDKRQPKVIEEWVQTQVSNPEGSSKHILSIGLENDNFDNLFVFPEMKSLKKLSLKNNNISSIEKNALSKLLVLEELDLSHNSINSHDLRDDVFYDSERIHFLKNYVDNKPVLKTLKLGYNKIHSLSPFCFKHLNSLERLELNNNPLKVIDQNTEITFGQLKNLLFLDLSNTGLSEFVPGMFAQLFKVQTLYLNGNNFQTIPKEIRDMPLAYLNINTNPISNLDNESFIGLGEIQQLVISGMPQLTNIESGTFVPLKKLITLNMAYNPNLKNIHYDAFRDHTTNHWPLRQLFLSNNNLSSLDSKVYSWTKLEVFDAKTNPWTCDCKLSWLANYINQTFAEIPETLLYYRCKEPIEQAGTLLSQLNENIYCDEHELFLIHENHSHGHVARLKHFVIVIGLVVCIFVISTLMNTCFRELKKVFKPRICVASRFSTGVKYRPADFDDCSDTFEVPVHSSANQGRSPIVINNTD